MSERKTDIQDKTAGGTDCIKAGIQEISADGISGYAKTDTDNSVQAGLQDSPADSCGSAKALQDFTHSSGHTPKKEQKTSLLKSGSVLSVLTFLSRILGLIREMVKSSLMGTTPLADAFTVAFMIPNLLRRLFAENSITVAFIPTFKKLLEDETMNAEARKEEIRYFLNSVFTLVTLALTVVAALGIAASPYIIKLCFPKIADYDSAVLLTRIMFPYLLLISLAAFFQGILNGVKVFSPSGFTPVLFNLIVIGLTYALLKPLSNAAAAMACGVVSGGFVQAVFQIPFVLKKGFRFSFISLQKTFANKNMHKTLKLIAPTIIGMAAYQINDLVSTSLATSAGKGVASSLQYSLRLQELMLGIFAVSVGSVILPDLSSFAMKKNWRAFENLLVQAIKIIALITIPATFFSLCSGEQIVSLIYKNSRFGSESVSLTLSAFRWHIAGLFMIALNRITAPAFYAQSDSKSPTAAGIASFAVNIILASVLVHTMAGGGIALALTLASTVNTILLFAFMRRKNNIEIKRVLYPVIIFTLKILLFSLIASAPLYFLGDVIYSPFKNSDSKLINLALPLLISFIIFSAAGCSMLILTKDSTALNVIKKLKRKS